MDTFVYRFSGSKGVASVKGTMLFNLLGNEGRILTERLGNIFHGHVLTKTFLDKYPVVKS